MYKTRISEWILSLAMSREHAAAAVGDLVETSSLSPLTVMRIALAAILRGAWSSPVRVTTLAFAGFIGQFLLFTPVALLGLLVLPRQESRLWLFMLIMRCLHCVTSFLAGRWLAMCAPGRELSICFALGILNLAASLMNVNDVSINMAYWQIPIIVGALTARRRYLRHA